MPVANYTNNVFINCPFDEDYLPIMEALIFAVHDCGYIARSALETEDSGEVRIDKIVRIIRNCRFGIHDISRTEPSIRSGLPRFNMPLELGLFLGAKRFGSKEDKRKTCLILDRERFRYQQFCSDIAGQDIQGHEGKPELAIKAVRNWLRNTSRLSIPGGGLMVDRFRHYRHDLPLICSRMQLDQRELLFNEHTTLIAEWIKAHTWKPAGTLEEP